MLKRIEFEAKNLQEAEKYAVETLRIQKDKLKLTVLKEKKGLFNIGFLAGEILVRLNGVSVIKL